VFHLERQPDGAIFHTPQLVDAAESCPTSGRHPRLTRSSLQGVGGSPL
jgi:hypothetical protein